jgi:hypothetical protein
LIFSIKVLGSDVNFEAEFIALLRRAADLVAIDVTAAQRDGCSLAIQNHPNCTARPRVKIVRGLACHGSSSQELEPGKPGRFTPQTILRSNQIRKQQSQRFAPSRYRTSLDMNFAKGHISRRFGSGKPMPAQMRLASFIKSSSSALAHEDELSGGTIKPELIAGEPPNLIPGVDLAACNPQCSDAFRRCRSATSAKPTLDRSRREPCSAPRIPSLPIPRRPMVMAGLMDAEASEGNALS